MIQFKNSLKIIINIAMWILPWNLRRLILEYLYDYKIHHSSRIGFSIILPKMLIMGKDTTIRHLTICKNIDLLHLKESSSIGNGNWITGFPSNTSSSHFSAEKDRKPELVIEMHSSITNRHIIDCTNAIHIGKFCTIAGFNSQILTHSIDIPTSTQKSSPINIGNYTFIGTNCVVIGGSSLPDYSVLSSKSFLNKKFDTPNSLYGGVPAILIKPMPLESNLYFSRERGFVV
jgi:acetyltransferase-like isoleucine patch superfamily enzyme